MTTDHTTDADLDLIEEATRSATNILRRRIDEMERARDEQPELLAKARGEAEEARGWALLEEPLESQISPLVSIDGAAQLALPNILAKELWGARLCFDVIDCGDDYEQIDAVISRLFSAAKGDTGVTMAIMAAALSTIAALVVPQLLDEIEHGASNYTERVRLAEARAKAWQGRAGELRSVSEGLEEQGVKPLDSFDIGAAALEPDAELGDRHD